MRRVLTTMLLLLVVSPAWATEYFVSKSGSNANSCATAQSPGTSAKLTVAGGVSCLASGDTLTIQDGTYVESLSDTVPSGGGTWETATVLRAENSRQAILQPTGTHIVAFDDAERNWIILQGLVFDGVNASGLGVKQSTNDALNSGFSHHIRLDDVVVKNTTSACVQWQNNSNAASSLQGRNNELINSLLDNCGTTINNQGVYWNSHSSLVRGTEIRGSFGDAITLFTSSNGRPNDAVIEDNYLHGNGTLGEKGGGIIISNTSRAIVRRNIIVNNLVDDGIDISVGECDDCDLDNNTIVGNDAKGINASHTSSTGIRIRNNLVVGNTGGQITLCGTCGTQTTNTTTGVLADLFTDSATDDYTLKAGSAAIDAGTDIGFGQNGSAPDAGAFETLVFSSGEVGNVDATSLILTFENNVNPPLLPSTGITGITVREDASPVTVSSCVRQGTNQVDCTLAGSITGGTTVDFSYSQTGNLTDSALIGDSLNQELLAITNQAVTNNVGGGGSHAWTQTRFQWHGLRGTEAAPIVKPHANAAEGTNIHVVPGGKARVRIKVECITADCPSIGMALRYSLNAGGYTVVPDAFGADNIRFYGTSDSDSDVPAQGTATTEQLTSDHVTNVACSIVRTSNAIPTIDLSQNSEAECEYVLEWDTDAVVGDTYDFRLYDQGGTALDTYDVTPRATIRAMSAGAGF